MALQNRCNGIPHACGNHCFLLLIAAALVATKPVPQAKAKSPRDATPTSTDRIWFAADDFMAQLPWFYHGLPFDKVQGHDVHSFEANALDLRPGEYTVVLVPKAELNGVAIRNRMLSFYVKTPGAARQSPPAAGSRPGPG